MRLHITGGILRSRQFETPGNQTTHPMCERFRLALFNSLGDISGQTVLDPFVGSGALSFEALSRGAQHATLIERDRQAQKIIQANAENLGLLPHATIVNGSAQTWSSQNTDAQFDLILCDPPYDDLQLTTMAQLVQNLKPGGTFALSYSANLPVPEIQGLTLSKQSRKNYGGARLAYYKKAADSLRT